ncbi:MAG TPA: glycoside hydrolase family 36 protein [Mycobacteriales bacterium]
MTDPAGRFRTVADVPCDPTRARVYEHGWQSWSPTGRYPATATSRRPAGAAAQAIAYRAGAPAPPTGFQGEGLVAVEPAPGEAVRLFAVTDAGGAIPSIRVRPGGTGLLVSSDGEIADTTVAAPLGAALARWAEHLAPPDRPSGPLPSVWCSWYCYWEDVTEADIRRNLGDLDRLDLDVAVVQVDDGWSAGIGDWLDTNAKFGDLGALATRIRDTGRRAGIWVAPFLAGARSRLAADHPDWLVPEADAGHNWDQDLFALDLTRPEVAEHLGTVFASLAAAGFDYFKLDFLYAGALPGPRHGGIDGLEAYRNGMRVIRAAVPAGATLIGSGAPMLPSIGLVDGMRVGPDVARPALADAKSRIGTAIATGSARSFQHGRWWINDPDCLLLRPAMPQRDRWAGYVEASGGLKACSDPLAELDDWGLRTARRLLRPATPGPVDLVGDGGLAGRGTAAP